jgi:hypothetical protein
MDEYAIGDVESVEGAGDGSGRWHRWKELQGNGKNREIKELRENASLSISAPLRCVL